MQSRVNKLNRYRLVGNEMINSVQWLGSQTNVVNIMAVQRWTDNGGNRLEWAVNNHTSRQRTKLGCLTEQRETCDEFYGSESFGLYDYFEGK